MSQAQDMAAIANLFNRTVTKNSTALGLKQAFQTWYDGLGPIDRNFSTSILVEAKNRRDAFLRANSTAGVAPVGASAPAQLAVGVIPPGKYPDIRMATRKTNDKNAVKLVQRFLKANPIDGDFGPQTDTLVKNYQKTHKDTAGKSLKSDGWVSTKTWDAMIRDSRAIMTTPTNTAVAAAQAAAAVNRPPTPQPSVATSAPIAANSIASKPKPPAVKPKPKTEVKPTASAVQVAAKKAAEKAAAGKPISAPDLPPALTAHVAAAKEQLTQAANDFRAAPLWARIGICGIGAVAAVLGVKAIAKAAA